MVEEQDGVATHVRKPGYSCTSPSRLLIPDRKLASSHRHMRQYVALLSCPVLTACLWFCHPCCREVCALFQRPLSPPRSSSEKPPWFQLAHHVGTNQDNADVDCANRCTMFTLLSVCPETLHMPADL